MIDPDVFQEALNGFLLMFEGSVDRKPVSAPLNAGVRDRGPGGPDCGGGRTGAPRLGFKDGGDARAHPPAQPYPSRRTQPDGQ